MQWVYTVGQYMHHYTVPMRIAVGMIAIGYGLRIWAALTEKKGAHNGRQ